MFKFFRKYQNLSLQVDIHAHLLPSIDDGPKSVEESIRLIEGLLQLGYTRLCATPHVYKEYYPNDRKEILEKHELIQQELKERALEVELTCAAEYYLDDHFLELLDKKQILPIAGQYLLVEDDFLERSERIENFIFTIRAKGYIPILAHPERFPHIVKNTNRIAKLKRMGCLFQLNLLSLTGYYGVEARQYGKALLKKGHIDLLGTDLHNEKQLSVLKKVLTLNRHKRLLQNFAFKNHTLFQNTKTSKHQTTIIS